jgi:hypothetical protein
VYVLEYETGVEVAFQELTPSMIAASLLLTALGESQYC